MTRRVYDFQELLGRAGDALWLQDYRTAERLYWLAAHVAPNRPLETAMLENAWCCQERMAPSTRRGEAA